MTELENVALGFLGGLKLVSLALDNDGNPRIASVEYRVVNYAALNGGDWSTDIVLDSGADRYNGLFELRTNLITDEPAIGFWELDSVQTDVVRLISLPSCPLLGDVNSYGVLHSVDIDLTVQRIAEPTDLSYGVAEEMAVDIGNFNSWIMISGTYAEVTQIWTVSSIALSSYRSWPPKG